MEVITRLESLFPSVDATIYEKPEDFLQCSSVSYLTDETPPKQSANSQSKSSAPLKAADPVLKAKLGYYPGDTADLIVTDLNPTEANIAGISVSCRVVNDVCYVSRVNTYRCICDKCMENAQFGVTNIVTSPILPVYTVTYTKCDEEFMYPSTRRPVEIKKTH
jgi:hypothetical protein